MKIKTSSKAEPLKDGSESQKARVWAQIWAEIGREVARASGECASRQNPSMLASTPIEIAGGGGTTSSARQMRIGAARPCIGVETGRPLTAGARALTSFAKPCDPHKGIAANVWGVVSPTAASWPTSCRRAGAGCRTRRIPGIQPEEESCHGSP